jgi:hypothetical protein
MKEVFYVAHPVSGDAEANAYRAIDWIRWLTTHDPTRVYVAPWVAEVLAFVDDGPINKDFYARVLEDDVEVVKRLDGILLVGGHISFGMTKEIDAALAKGKKLIDWSSFKTPADVPQGVVPGDIIPSRY